MELDRVLCAAHGWVSHVAVHEAAHAVIAYARGIPFVDITVAHPAEIEGILHGGSAMAGGLRLTIADPRLWVPERGDDAVDLLMAGVIAERLTYGHSLPNSATGDMQILVRGMGWSPPAYDPQTVQDAVANSERRLEQELPERYPAIKRIVAGLTSELNVDGHGQYFDFHRGLSLRADEVIALIENH